MEYVDLNYYRAMIMLNDLEYSANDLIDFWKMFGPYHIGPTIERCEKNWWQIP